MLNTGWMYTFDHHTSELSGMYVVASKPISVIAGSSRTYGVPGSCANSDSLAVCIPPVWALGLTYILPPLAGRAVTTGYYAHIVGAFDNTQVLTTQNVDIQTIMRGQKMLLIMNSPEPITVSCSKRCLVVIYNKPNCADAGEIETFMMLVPSVSQTTAYTVFNTLEPHRYFIKSNTSNHTKYQ